MFSFTISEIPAGLDSYGVKITDRGTVNYTEDEMVAGPELTLGD